MSDQDELKKRLQQLENELNQPKDNYQKVTASTQKTKTPKSKLTFKYKFLIWFVVGLVAFAGISLVIGAETLYLFFATLSLFIAQLSFLAFMLLLALPSLLIAFVIYKIYKWLV